MNPTYFDDAQAPDRKRRSLLGVARRLVRIVFKILLFNPLARCPGDFRDEVGSRFSRTVRSVGYRLAFVPLVLVMTVAVLVFAATHPPQVAPSQDPGAEGLFFEPVSFASADGTRLEGWLVPVLSAHRILSEGEQALRQRHPAVVLVHDYGASKQQMLPLVRPLHEAGMVVFAISLRGSGSSAGGGHTFGLREREDVAAAVELLRRRQQVDPQRVALVGLGSGATACLLAARSDPGVAAVVVQSPPPDFTQVLEQRLGPRQPWMHWLNPLCRWSFEIAYQVNSNDVGFQPQGWDGQPRLVIEGGEQRTNLFVNPHRRQVVRFLEDVLQPGD